METPAKIKIKKDKNENVLITDLHILVIKICSKFDDKSSMVKSYGLDSRQTHTYTIAKPHLPPRGQTGKLLKEKEFHLGGLLPLPCPPKSTCNYNDTQKMIKWHVNCISLSPSPHKVGMGVVAVGGQTGDISNKGDGLQEEHQE